jgi:hypothetical protein
MSFIKHSLTTKILNYFNLILLKRINKKNLIFFNYDYLSIKLIS